MFFLFSCVFFYYQTEYNFSIPYICQDFLHQDKFMVGGRYKLIQICDLREVCWAGFCLVMVMQSVLIPQCSDVTEQTALKPSLCKLKKLQIQKFWYQLSFVPH